MSSKVRLIDLIELKVFRITWMQASSSTVICSGSTVISSAMIRSYRQCGNQSERGQVQIDALLCNHAEAVNNLLYLSGGGVEIALVQPGTAPPYLCNLAIGILVTVPWGQTNQQHMVDIHLLSEDGEPVLVPTGPDVQQPLQARLAFNVGRPAGLTVGDDQHVALAANLPSLPMPSLGKYEFVIRLDGHDERRLGYRVMLSQGTQIVGPAAQHGPNALPA